MASERVGTFQTNEGDVIYKEKDSDGQLRYRRGATSSSGKQGGSFINPDLGKSLEKAARSSTDQTSTQPEQAQIITPTGERDREQLLAQKYLQYNNTQGRNPRQLRPGDSRRETAIKIWMDNETLKQKIDNDPLLDTNSERRKAAEALAMEIADELENVENERARIAILRQYDIY